MKVPFLLAPLVLASWSAFAAEAEKSTALPVFQGETTVVTGTRTESNVQRLASEVTVLRNEDLTRSGAATLGEALANQPGLEWARNGGAGQGGSLFIRGAESDHTLFLVDGVRVNSVSTGATAFELLPLAAIDHVEILRGPASSLYGPDAIGGVVQVFTRQGQGKPQAFAGVEYGTWGQKDVHAGLSGALNDTRFSLATNYGEGRMFSAIKNPKSPLYEADRDGYRRSGATGSVSHFVADGHEIGIQAQYQQQANDIDSGAQTTPEAKEYQRLASGRIFSRNQWTEQLQTEVYAAEGRNAYHTAPDDSNPRDDRFNTAQDQYGASARLKTALGQWLLAYDYLRERLSSGVNFSSQSRTNQSGLLGWQGDFGMHHLEAQIRHDDNNRYGNHDTGRLGYALLPGAGWKVYANAGTAFKAPTFNDAYWPEYLDNYPGAYYYRYVGNAELKPERSRNMELGVNWQKESQRFSVAIYRNRIKDLITTVTFNDYSNPLYPWGYTDARIQNVASATIKGLDASAAFRIGRFTWEGWGTWLDARDDSSDKWLPRRARLSGGNRVTVAINGPLSLFVEGTGQAARYDDSDNTTAKRMHGYGLVNVGADYQLSKQWKLGVRVNNVFDRQYELAKDYATPGVNGLIRINWRGDL